MKKVLYTASLCLLIMHAQSQQKNVSTSLPRSTPEAENVSAEGIDKYLITVNDKLKGLHSLMIVRHGKVVSEHWFGVGSPDEPHVLNSVSKTFTAAAIGFAVAEKRLKITDKVISFFPDDLPPKVSPFLKELDIKHLLTMTAGQDLGWVGSIADKDGIVNWVKLFLAVPIKYKPGTVFGYSKLNTFMLSAIIQKVTGQTMLDYLNTKMFGPLGVSGAFWEENVQGIDKGGWGLFLKTEDMAKFGQLLLQKGKWEGKQLLPESWVNSATSKQTESVPGGMTREAILKDPAKLEQFTDWIQGYGYQMWMCRDNAVRADGYLGQYIIVIPEKDAVIVTTADIVDMETELNLVWKYIFPALK